MEPLDFMEATQELISFAMLDPSPCCGLSDRKIEPFVTEDYFGINCSCGASWAVQTKRYGMLDFAREISETFDMPELKPPGREWEGE